MKTMQKCKYHSGITVRAYLSDWHKIIVAKNDNARRYVYNKCVEIDKELFSLQKVKIYCDPVVNRINYLKTLRGSYREISNMAPFLNEKEVDSLAKANAIKNHRQAWENFKNINGASIPTFHKKSYDKKYQTNAQYSKNADGNVLSEGSVRFLDKSHVCLPILGRIRIKGSPKQLKALYDMDHVRIGTVTVKIDACGDAFISFQLGSDCPFASVLPKTDKMIGIDVNIENFFSTSDGDIIPNPKYYSSSQSSLAKAQWKLSRKVVRAKRENRSIYDSKNLQKQRIKVSKIQRKIKRQRDEYQHICSKDLVESQDYIFSEDLRVKNMLKNHKLAKSISDVAWGSFLHKLEYKSDLYDKTYLKVNARNTTQTCSCCGYILEGENRLSLKDRGWVCPNCGEMHNRDINSAINVLQRGMKVLNLS